MKGEQETKTLQISREKKAYLTKSGQMLAINFLNSRSNKNSLKKHKVSFQTVLHYENII